MVRKVVDRTAIFVDAGYLFASGSKLVVGEKLTRSQLHLDHDAVLAFLVDVASQLSGLPLLRSYWYDGASVGPSPAHVALAYHPELKLRLGSVNEGQQRNVDELIAGDLTSLAAHRAIADAVLLSGDEDLLPAVERAQELGVRVHLLGIAPSRENQAASLAQAADLRRELTQAEVMRFLSRRRTATDGR
jgi:uncharacterized LabA/DUF88 family protein